MDHNPDFLKQREKYVQEQAAKTEGRRHPLRPHCFAEDSNGKQFWMLEDLEGFRFCRTDAWSNPGGKERPSTRDVDGPKWSTLATNEETLRALLEQLQFAEHDTDKIVLRKVGEFVEGLDLKQKQRGRARRRQATAIRQLGVNADMMDSWGSGRSKRERKTVDYAGKEYDKQFEEVSGRRGRSGGAQEKVQRVPKAAPAPARSSGSRRSRAAARAGEEETTTSAAAEETMVADEAELSSLALEGELERKKAQLAAELRAHNMADDSDSEDSGPASDEDSDASAKSPLGADVGTGAEASEDNAADNTEVDPSAEEDPANEPAAKVALAEAEEPQKKLQPEGAGSSSADGHTSGETNEGVELELELEVAAESEGGPSSVVETLTVAPATHVPVLLETNTTAAISKTSAVDNAASECTSTTTAEASSSISTETAAGVSTPTIFLQ
jgi:hypothetical protein